MPWYIQRQDGSPLAFAGIWQSWGMGDTAINTCAIVTTGANQSMEQIHHRMPVILEPDDWPLWLGEQGKGAAPLMQAAQDDVLKFWGVDSVANSNRASGPELIELFEPD